MTNKKTCSNWLKWKFETTLCKTLALGLGTNLSLWSRTAGPFLASMPQSKPHLLLKCYSQHPPLPDPLLCSPPCLICIVLPAPWEIFYVTNKAVACPTYSIHAAGWLPLKYSMWMAQHKDLYFTDFSGQRREHSLQRQVNTGSTLTKFWIVYALLSIQSESSRGFKKERLDWQKMIKRPFGNFSMEGWVNTLQACTDRSFAKIAAICVLWCEW